MDKTEFEKDRAIDPGQLDVECVRQADVFFKWAERSVEAKAEVERFELAKDVLEATLAMQVRAAPERFGLVDPKEAAYKAAVACDKGLIAAEDALIKARLTAALLQQAVVTMDQRKRMLESLVTLHGQEYFAGPSVPRNLVDAWNTYSKNRESNVNEKQTASARRRVRKEE